MTMSGFRETSITQLTVVTCGRVSAQCIYTHTHTQCPREREHCVKIYTSRQNGVCVCAVREWDSLERGKNVHTQRFEGRVHFI